MGLLTWMLYTTVIGALLGAAAWLLERGLLRLDRPVRWVWALALVATLAIALVAAGTGPGPDLAADAAPVPAAPPTATAAALSPDGEVPFGPEAADAGRKAELIRGRTALAPLGAVGSALGAALTHAVEALPLPPLSNTTLALAWAGGGLLFTIVLGTSAVGLARRRRRWPTVRIEGGRARISSGLGPAVVGVVRPEVVLPRWALALPPGRLRLALLHEREHVAARDTLLLAGATLLLLLLFWNPAVWWIHGRLRAAVEMDCDRRVLDRGVSRRAYGSLLLEVATDRRRFPLPVAALTEHTNLLERRLRQMTRSSARHGTLTLIASGVLALLLVVVACETRTPSPAEATGPEAAEASEAALARGGALTGVVWTTKGDPLSGAAVHLEGTGYGALANAQGRFVIRNVPPGTHNLMVRRMGYAPARFGNVRVMSGETSSVEFTLREDVVRLQAIVVH